MTTHEIKTRKENEKHLQIALVLASGICFVSSYSESLISWWQIHVYSAHVCSRYSAEKTQEVSHMPAYFSIVLSRPNDHVSWEIEVGEES